MTWLSLFRRARLDSAPRRGRSAVSRPRRTHLGIEILEDRSVPAVFIVNSLADLTIAGGVNANGTIVGQGNTVTLRSAIQAANNTPGGNTIDLNVAGTYRIQLAPTVANESDNAAGEFAILPEGNLTIQNSSGGTVTVDGGGLARVFDINPANTNNPATKFAVTLQGFTIQDGKAFDATGANPDGAVASGGGIRDQGNQSLTLTDMIVTGNSATADGGGISMENSVSTAWKLTITDSTISNNTAGDAGGGVEEDGSGTVTITGTAITGNTCVNQGGGIWLDAIADNNGNPVTANLTVTGSYIGGNKAAAANMPGGGIGNAGNGAVTIVDSDVVNNSAGGQGGGFGDEDNNFGSLTVLNSTFAGNEAAGDGGGIEFGGMANFLVISDSTITDNYSQSDGGGLAIGAPIYDLHNSIVAGNFAGPQNFLDGAVVAVTITDAGFGYNAEALPTVTFSAAPAGGTTATGIPTTGAHGEITAITITNPGAGYTTPPTVTIQPPEGGFQASATAVIGGLGPDIFAPGEVLVGNNNFIGSNDGNLLLGVGDTGNQIGTPAAPLDPLLGPLQNNGGPSAGAPGDQQVLLTAAPLPGSPVIDTGSNAGIGTDPNTNATALTDERGFQRIVNTTVDIGAVEYQPSATTTTLLAPSSALAGDPIGLLAIVRASTPDSNPVSGFVTFTVDGVPVGAAAVGNGVAAFTLPTLPPGAYTLGATYDGSVLFGASSGFATESVAAATPSLLPDATIPAGTVLSAPPNDFVFISVMTVKMHGKKFQEFVVTNTSGAFILGRFVFAGLSLKQYGQLFGLSQKQLNNLPTFDGSPVVDLFLAPDGQQTVLVPAGAAFNPLVVAGL